MRITYSDGGATLHGACDFNAEHTFECGQCFRFERTENGYEGVALGGYLRVEKAEDGVFIYPCTPEEYEGKWRNYFDFDRDYGCLFTEGDAACGALGESLKCARGLRILNQPPFETLISFIISANNNVGRIRGIIRRLCERYGGTLNFEGRTFYDFPTPAALAGAEESGIAACGAGYRAPYIKNAARAVADGFDLAALRDMPYGDAKRALMALPGVGPKVADCVLLFALGHTRAFPADVWIKRALKDHYGFKGNDRQTAAFALERFGAHAGIAQQYLFYWIKGKEKP